MKKLSGVYSEQRLLRSHGNSRGMTHIETPAFKTFAPADYINASVPRNHARARRPLVTVGSSLPENVVRLAAPRDSLRQA